MTTTTIKLPGKFCDWFDGTGLAQRQDDADPECKATADAYLDSTYRPAGAGYFREVTGGIVVMEVLKEYGGYCVMSNADEPDTAEVAAARKVIERAQEALSGLKNPVVPPREG